MKRAAAASAPCGARAKFEADKLKLTLPCEPVRLITEHGENALGPALLAVLLLAPPLDLYPDAVRGKGSRLTR